MRKYKRAKVAEREKVKTERYYYRYTCPFCKGTYINHNMKCNVLMIRCCECNNKIKFEDDECNK